MVLAVPYAVMGPGYFREDWAWLRNARLDGAWEAAGNELARARPLTGPVYAFLFGTLGSHPLAVYASLVALNAAAAVLLFLIVREFVSHRVAFGAAVAWVVVPSHSSLRNWASTGHILLAVVVMLAGALLAVRALRRNRQPWVGAAVLALSGLIYEATLPAAAVVLIAGPLILGRRVRPASILPAALLVPVGAYAALNTEKRPAGLIRLGDVVSSNFGWGVTDSRFWLAVQVVALVGITVALWRLVRALRAGERPMAVDAVVAAGLVILVVGALPYLWFGGDIDFVAQGDRANSISALGAAAVWASLASMAPGRWWLAVIAALCVVSLPTRFSQDADWAGTSDDVERALDLVDAALGSRRGGSVVVGPAPVSRGGVEGIENDWDTTNAVQARRRDPDVRVRFVYSEAELARHPGSIDLRRRRR